jgi:hypothetical protein
MLDLRAAAFGKRFAFSNTLMAGDLGDTRKNQ